MELLFKILLIAIFVTGHVFGYILFYKEDSKYNNGILINLFTAIYPLILFLTFLAWILSNRYSSIRLGYLIGLNFTYIISSVLSALASNIILQKIENKINSTKSSVYYVLRLVIMGYGAFCIASSISVTKSSLYLLNVTNYEFGEEIISIIEKNSNKQIYKMNDESLKLSYFLNDVKQIDNDTLKISRKNIFSFFTGKYLIEIGDNYDFELSYEYSPSSRDKPIDVHNVIYKSKKHDYDCFVNINTTGGRIHFLETVELIQKINKQLLEFKSIKLQIKTKPAGLLDFAFSSLMDSFGVQDYDFKSMNKKSERIDQILKWLFWIITSIIFFEFTRNWKSQKNN